MTYNTLGYDIDDGILILRLNRPHKMNAFTVEMSAELVDAYARASADDHVRAIVVTGAGEAFCAGMDLSARGNVFGLDESMQPTLKDLHDRFDDPDIRDGVRDRLIEKHMLAGTRGSLCGFSMHIVGRRVDDRFDRAVFQ